MRVDDSQATQEAKTAKNRVLPGRRERVRLASLGLRLHLRNAFLLVGALLVGAFAVFLFRPASGRPFRPASGRDSTDLARLVNPGDASGFNLVLVSLDTVRSDHLGCYGYELAETPNIDALVQHGVQFDDAVTAVPLTLPSHATMMTGLYPPRHGVLANGLSRLASSHDTLAEDLKEHGYETAAFIGSFVLDEHCGLAQGFDTYDFQVSDAGYYPGNPTMNRRPADEVTDAAVSWLRKRQEEGRSKPFFMFVHYFDAHVPHSSPLTKARRFADRPYDACIAYIDQEFGPLLAALDTAGLRERTLLVVVSDHGEGLGEHGESTHGTFLYGATVRVVFILSCPGLFQAGPYHVRDHIVSLTDLRPTLEDLLGLPVPKPVDGMNLVTDVPGKDRAVYIGTRLPFYVARCSPLYGLQRHADKYIRAPEPEYYDLAADPGELHNLYAKRPSMAGPLAQELTRMQQGWGAPDAESRRGLSAEERSRLGSLGYVQSAGGVATEDLPDPKAMIRSSEQCTAAIRAWMAGRREEAVKLASEALKGCRGLSDAASLLAQFDTELQRPAEAIEVLKSSFAVNPAPEIALNWPTRSCSSVATTRWRRTCGRSSRWGR